MPPNVHQPTSKATYRYLHLWTDGKVHHSEYCPSWLPSSRLVQLKIIKAHSNGSNMLVKHYQTLLDATCLTHLKKHNQTCWIVLDDVGWSLSLLKLFIQHPKTRYNFVPGTEIQHFWMVLDSFEHSSIQHWWNTVQHHQTMLDNVWPTCLICLNWPLLSWECFL